MKTLARVPSSLVVVVAAFFLMWLFLSQGSNPTWDAGFYYAYARSVVFDGNLKIDNDLRLSYPTATYDFVNKGYDQIRTESGRIYSPFAPGSSLLWLPWLGIARIIAAVGQLVNILPDQLSGYEWYFTFTTSAWSALLGLVALWLGYLVAYPVTSKTSGLIAILTLLVSTPLIYYQFREPLYSHASSAFANGIVVYLWWRSYRQEPSYKRALLIGGAIGLASLVRWQNIVYVVLPLISVLWWWLDLPPSERRIKWKRILIYGVLMGLAVLAFLSLQFSHWKLLYGTIVTVPQGDTFVNWAAPFWIQVLFSPFRGLLPWMPVAFLAVLGLVLMGKKRKRLVAPMLILLLVTLYVNGSTLDWFGGGGYGPRRFSSELAIFVVGYSGFIQAIPKKIRLPAAAILWIGLFLHQMILLRFGLEERIGGRVLSMSPEFRWAEVSYGEMLNSIVGHLADIVNSPRNFFVQFRSPIAELLDGRLPGQQFFALLAAASFLLLILLLFKISLDRNRGSSDMHYWSGVVLAAVVILLANVWILNWA